MDKIFFATLLIASVVSVTSCLVLAPLYGATGAALALLLGEIVLALIYISTTYFQIKNLKIKICKSFSQQQIDRIEARPYE
jgi:O-antigen/teichoic acid export membrane protein